ncbi:NlpC/P60 family protein [Shinella pollutisoli]|uniref:NlpC/P60 family protein n=1 Tax=Shinella pollutisoli TaxID=2250594 RepID=A0ABV7DLI9_9HYPH|nr:NlpC/P60 family protein [Shinella pollutisoli]
MSDAPVVPRHPPLAGRPEGGKRTGDDHAARIVAIARTFVGTPYRHQGSLKGVGCDCLGLVRGVWRELYGREPEVPRPYAPDWAERAGEERLLLAAARHCGAALPVSELQAGDLVIFRWQAGAAAKHAGIAAPGGRFIHAYEQAAVVESPLTPSWRRRIAGVFRFPEQP